MANPKIEPQASIKCTIFDGRLETSRVEIEGWITIDYEKYLNGESLLNCLKLDPNNSDTTNFPSLPE